MTGPRVRRGPAATYRTVTVDHPADLDGGRDADAVILNNRPGWQRYVAAPTLHLFHNWPDAWAWPPARTLPPWWRGRRPRR